MANIASFTKVLIAATFQRWLSRKYLLANSLVWDTCTSYKSTDDDDRDAS